MAILNYTTSIAVNKTVGEIQTILIKAKAIAVLSEFADGAPSAVSFRIMTSFGVMTFRLPANVQKIYQVMVRDRNVPPKFRTREQAARVAWRIVKDWLEAQMAMISAEMVDIQQVFLPYAQNEAGAAFYDSLKESGFSGLALPAPKSTTTVP